MSGAATAVMAAAAVAGAAISYKNGQEQKEAAEKASQQAKQAAEQQATQAEQAAQQAEANAKKQEKTAEEATNRASQKRANTNSVLDAATQAGKSGASGTMLTGPQGIDPAALNLSKNTLLGS